MPRAVVFLSNVLPHILAYPLRSRHLPNLSRAQALRRGWNDDAIAEHFPLTPGRIVPLGNSHTRQKSLRPDYVLFIRRNIPIAVVEAKAEHKHPAAGLQQALQYAEMLGVKFAYASNGKGIVEHDFITGLERDLDAFPSPDELWGRLQGTLQLPTPQDAADALTAYFEQAGGKEA